MSIEPGYRHGLGAKAQLPPSSQEGGDTMSLGEGARGAREKGGCCGTSTRVWREGWKRGEQAMEEAEGVGSV